jgi:hypothetical protein
MAFRKMVLSVFGLVIVASMVSGCAVAEMRRKAELAERDLIGLSRDALVDCAGEPAHVEQTGEREMLYYVAEDPEAENQTRASTCVASFTVRRGYVEHLHYETLAGRLVKERENCVPIIESCMSVN